MKQYRVGLLGFGFIGKVHAYAHRTIPLFYDQQDFGTVISSVCTAHPASAEKASALTGAAHAVTDYREITENPDIDIVDICTPNADHCEALLSAIAHNKHIYCDKPITADMAQARRVEAALKFYRGIAQMTFQNRFFPSTLLAKRLIDEGRIGDILEFRGRFLHSGSVDPEAPYKWKLNAGTIADLGSHVLDLVSLLTGDFVRLSAATHIAYTERPAWGNPGKRCAVTAEDNMFVTAQLANGACGTVSASKIATGAEDELSLEIHGTRGALKLLPMNYDKLLFYDNTLKIDGKGGWITLDCGQRYDVPAGFPTPKAPIGWLRGHVHCLYHFVNAVHTGIQPEPSLARGIQVQNLMDAVKRSAAEQRWVEL